MAGKGKEAFELLNESREVLYGEQNEPITMQTMYQLLVGINNRLSTIEKGMTKIDNLNKTLNNLVSNFCELKVKVNKIEVSTKNLKEKSDKQESDITRMKQEQTDTGKDVRELKKKMTNITGDLQGISNIMDDFKEKHDNNVKDVKLVKSSLSKVANDLEDSSLEIRQEIKSALSDVREENAEMRNTLIDLQCRSMKYNLIFTGLNEEENENTEQVVREFIRQELRINHWLEFGNVHRFGGGAPPGKKGRPRPIVVRFLYHKDLAFVLTNTYRLKGKPYGVNQQFPDAIEQARKSLYPVMKEKRTLGCRVKLIRDILYVDGQVYTEQSDLTMSSEKTSDKHQPTGYRTPTDRPVNKRRRTSTPKSKI